MTNEFRNKVERVQKKHRKDIDYLSTLIYEIEGLNPADYGEFLYLLMDNVLEAKQKELMGIAESYAETERADFRECLSITDSPYNIQYDRI